MSAVILICRCCGEPYDRDEGIQHHTVVGCGPDGFGEALTYEDPPYNYNPRHGYCLACFLVCCGDRCAVVWNRPPLDSN